MKGRLKLSYVLTLCLTFTLAIAVPYLASAEVIEEWVARYNGRGGNGWDEAHAITVDTSGNIYVTGESEGDYVTVKYDTDGNQLWVARYNGPSNHTDRASAIALDTSGNVYVTGTSEGSGTGDDYATVKYDTDGNQLWVARYNGPGNNSDRASAIAVDASGNVYVTGYSWNGTDWTSSDYATVKYDIDGNQLWGVRYNGPENGSDDAIAVAIDASGNVYVTGGSESSGTDYDYATVKYDTDGNQLWAARYNGPENDYDWAGTLAVDALGNVYVTGTSEGSGTGDDYATVKYDADGNQLWAARYSGPGNGDDYAHAIAVDASGNVHVTGRSEGTGTNFDYTTVKYNTYGNQLWVARYNGPGNGYDWAWDLAVDASGNVYVTGRSFGSGTGGDYATVKYGADGNELWVKRYNGPGEDDNDDGTSALTIDALGNVYVTGYSYGSGTDNDYATLKYDTDGNQLWLARYNGPGNESDRASAIAVDASGNVYVTGESEGDYATLKYDTDGNQLWLKRYNGPGNDYDYANAIAVDTSGNVYVTGGSDGNGTSRDYATVKYDTNGNELWVKRYNGPGNDDDRANAIAIDLSGNVYVTGYSYGDETDFDYATVKYDTDGNQLWVKRYNGPGNGWDEAHAMAVDASGNVYVTGGSEGSGTDFDYATVKYDTDGNQLWVKRYNGPGNGWDEAHAMAVDASGNVYVTGYSCSGTEDDYYPTDYATIKYDTDGNQLWVKRYNGPGNGSDHATAIAVDASGNVHVTGYSCSGTDDDYYPTDYATVKYDTNGNELWVARYNGLGNRSDSAYAIAIDASGNVYVTGESYGEGTSDDYATVKYDADGNQLWVARYNGPGNGGDSAIAIAVDASGNVYITGESYGGGTLDDYATVKYEEGVKMDLPAGWSMISLPVRPEVATVTTLFPEAVVVYRYEKGAGYVRVQAGEELDVGVGYWILLNKPQPYVKEGTEITEYTIPVSDGWYMIGGCSMPADKMVTSGKIDVIYGYTQGYGYTRLLGSEPLEPGKGYWILFSNTSEGAEFTASTSVSE